MQISVLELLTSESLGGLRAAFAPTVPDSTGSACGRSLPIVARSVERGLVTVALLALGVTGPLAAQVGLASSPAQVSLVVRAAAGGTIAALGTERPLATGTRYRDAAVVLRVGANSAYRLVVKGTEPVTSGRRVWVRSAGGEFQELTPNASITIARGKAAGEWERQVEFRVESEDPAPRLPLPVRYELYIDPVL